MARTRTTICKKHQVFFNQNKKLHLQNVICFLTHINKNVKVHSNKQSTSYMTGSLLSSLPFLLFLYFSVKMTDHLPRMSAVQLDRWAAIKKSSSSKSPMLMGQNLSSLVTPSPEVDPPIPWGWSPHPLRHPMMLRVDLYKKPPPLPVFTPKPASSQASSQASKQHPRIACQLAFVQSQALVESTRRSYLAGVRHYTAFC